MGIFINFQLLNVYRLDPDQLALGGITILYHLHHEIFRAKVGKMGIFINF